MTTLLHQEVVRLLTHLDEVEGCPEFLLIYMWDPDPWPYTCRSLCGMAGFKQMKCRSYHIRQNSRHLRRHGFSSQRIPLKLQLTAPQSLNAGERVAIPVH